MNDYQSFLCEYGLTEDYVYQLSINQMDQCAMPDGYSLLVKPSKINGLGGFATQDYLVGELICPARVDDKRTPAGRYINHSATPNAAFYACADNDLLLISITPITQNEEITIDYRQAMDVNGAGIKPVFQFPALMQKSGLDIGAMSNRQKIEVAEWVLGNGVNIADDLPVRNFVYAGMYARELTIPAGVALTGKIHLEPHLCMVSQGDISIMTDDGIQRIKAPYTFEAKAGIKKLGFAHETTVFTTIHATALTDINELEAALMSDGDIAWVNDLMSGDMKCREQ